MLQNLRNASNTWIGRALLSIVMGLIIVAFAIWGIGNVFQGFRQNYVASVGSTEITQEAFKSEFQTTLQNLETQTHRPITAEQARMIGLDRRVLSKLVTEAALEQGAHSLGLQISDKQIAQLVVGDPAFKDAAGVFDRQRFNDVLRDYGYSEQSFFVAQRQAYLRRQVEEAIGGAMTTPRTALEAMNRYGAEARTIDYIVLPLKAAGEIPPPSTDQLKAFYDDRKNAYASPEFRSLVVLTVTPKTLMRPDAVSDAEAQQRYDQKKVERYATPETRDMQEVFFATADDAKAALDHLKGGTSFDAIADDAKRAGATVETGTKARADLFNKDMGDAAFALAEGGVTAPITTPSGVVLIHVTKIRPGSVRPFADVAGAIKAEIALERARDDIAKVHDQIEDARTAGKNLTEAAKAAGLEPRTIDAIDANGRDKAGKAVAGLTEPRKLIEAAYASNIGYDNETIETADHGYVWFEVAKVEPAHERPLDEVKAQVEAAWRTEEAAKRLAAKTADLAKKLDGGQTMAALAAAEGVEVKTTGDVRRVGTPPAGLPASVVVQVFNVEPGAAGGAAGADDSRILFKVTGSVTPPLDPANPQAKALADQFGASVTADLMAQFAAKVQADVGVNINEPALQAATGGETY